MSSRETFRECLPYAGDLARPRGQTGACLTCKHLYIHQQRLTNADLENSETQLEEVLRSSGVPPVGRGERATVAVYLLSLYQAIMGERHLKM